MYDVIIIGGGCAGLAAGMYCGRFGIKTLVLGESIGGTIILTDVVENYPGFIRLTGQELADKLKKHALDYKEFVEIKEQKIQDIKKTNNGFLVSDGKKTYRSKTIIYATGTKYRKLNVPGEKEFFSKGIHNCALCDGYAYRNKIIGVVGGSDSAAKEALLLTQYGKKVYIIYRGDKIHPEPINMERVKKNKKIEIIGKTNITEIKGDKKVTSVIFDKPYKGKKEFKLDALFVEIGHIPLTELAKKLGVKLDKNGEIIIDREAKTNIPGFFAAGDCVNTSFKQAIVGVGEAVSAAYSAYKYLEGEVKTK
nr:FAD-dependent oxidoreductase [Candidatus Woesearchaeota archaeon]